MPRRRVPDRREDLLGVLDLAALESDRTEKVARLEYPIDIVRDLELLRRAGGEPGADLELADARRGMRGQQPALGHGRSRRVGRLEVMGQCLPVPACVNQATERSLIPSPTLRARGHANMESNQPARWHQLN